MILVNGDLMLENALSNKVPPSHRTVTNQYTKHLLSSLSDAGEVVVERNPLGRREVVSRLVSGDTKVIKSRLRHLAS
jgi:hypothetical protein